MKVVGAAVLLCSVLCCCATPERQKQQRLSALNSFTRAAVLDLLDRNPATMSDSMNRVFGYEFADDARQKLMARNLLPETGLSVEKIIQDQQASKSSNSVSVSAVKPLGSLSKHVIPVRVTGLQIITRGGKRLSKRSFVLDLCIRLPTDDSDGNPRVVDAGASPQESRLGQGRRVADK